jgi:hypothetical protein
VVPADPLLADPALVAPAPGDSAPTDLLALDPVSLDPALTDPALTEALLTDPVPVAGGVLSVGLLPVPPPAGGLDGGNTVVGELLAGVDARGVARGLAELDGWVELVEQRDPVAPVVCLPLFALVLDFAEAVLLAWPVAVGVAFAVAVAVAVAVPVGVAVAVPVGVAVALSPALLLVLPLAGLLTEFAGGALDVADLADAAGLAWADDGEAGEHGATGTLLWTAEVPPAPAPPPGAFWVADPFRVGVPSELELEIPTADPRLTKAWRSGGTAKATPMANTAQAVASAGRSHPYRQSRCCCCCCCCCSPAPSVSWPPRAAFHRRTMPARKPTRAAACLLA